MKKTAVVLALSALTLSCKTQKVKDPETLPKDVSLKPERTATTADDQKQLAALRTEIMDMVSAENCTDASQWRISPLGSKPCGGPSEYIAYPKKIENEILPKIKNYTDLVSAYNKKNKLLSDCMMVPPPSGIRCENGKAIIIKNGFADIVQ